MMMLRIFLLLVATTHAFVPIRHQPSSFSLRETVAPEPAVQDIPTNLPSEKGMDYIPLATMLATGDFEQADQVCENGRGT